MSPARQIALSVGLLVVVAGGWLAYDRGWFGSNHSTPPAAEAPGANSAGGAASGPTGGNPNRGGGAPGGSAQGAGRSGGAPINVITAAVETDNSGFDVHAVGTVAAVRAVTLFPDATGVVSEVAFKPGTQVTAGQALVRLDDADQQVAVERARIALDGANLALDRAEQLAKSNNITTVALADARTAVQKAEIDLKAAELDLARRTLAAPFAGTVGLTDVTVGDLVNSSKPIATLDDMTTVTVSFELPERASGRVGIGQAISGTSEALPGHDFAGEVSAVDSRVDPVARTLKVEATLPNDANALKPGMALNVAIAFPGEEHPAVPSLAVQWDRNGPYVWKVDADKVKRVGVEIIGRRSGTVIVAGELAAGDDVVVEGLQRLREGAAVARGGGGPPTDPGQGAPGANGGGNDRPASG